MSYGSGKAAVRREERGVAFLFRQAGWQHCSGVNSLALSHDGRHLWTGSRDALIKRWDVSGAQPALEADLEGHIDWVNGLVLVGDDALVSASSDKTLRIWRAHSAGGQSEACWPGHGDYVTALAAAPGGPTVMSGGLRGELVIWDLEVLKPVAAAADGGDGRPRLPGSWVNGVTGSIYSLAVDASGRMVAAGTSDGVVWVLDARSGRCEARLMGHAGNVRALQMSADAAHFVSGSSDHTMRLWDLRQQRSTQTFAVHTDSVWALAADAALGEVYSGGRDGCVYRTRLASRLTELVAVEEQPVQALALGSAGGPLWVATTSSTLHGWGTARAAAGGRPEGGAPGSSFRPEGGAPGSSFTAGSLPAVRSRMSFDGGGARPRPLRLRPAATIPGTPPVRHAAVLTDRRHVLTRDAEGRVLLWDVTAGAVVRDLGQVALKDAERQLFDPAHNVSPWFQPDTRLGCLAGYMEVAQCFLAEAYRRELGDAAAPADVKLNMGEAMLKSLFRHWAERRAAGSASTATAADADAAAASGDGGAGSQDTAMHDANSSTAGAAADLAHHAAAGAEERAAFGDAAAGPVAFQMREPVAPVVMISGSGGIPPLRRAIDAFTGREREGQEIPQWVADCVLRSHYPQHRSVANDLKMFFVLQPAEGSGLPSLLQGRLSAPRVLGVDKVADYVVRKMADSSIALRVEPLFWAPEKQEQWEAEHSGSGGGMGGSGSSGGAVETRVGANGLGRDRAPGVLGLSLRQLRPLSASQAPHQGRPLLITCNGAAVPWDFTLAAVRQWMWKRPEDLKLEYGVRKEGVELKIPVIRPPV